jgi:purine-binding chemotaxis protein CheW
MQSEGQTADGGNRELLTFTLGDEEYGIDIIVPIVDMRIKFRLGKVNYDQFTVVIILNVANRVVGIVVDGVSDVIALTADQLKPAPEFSGAMDTQYILGLGTVDDRMIIVMDIEKLMTSRDMELVEAAAA